MQSSTICWLMAFMIPVPSSPPSARPRRRLAVPLAAPCRPPQDGCNPDRTHSTDHPRRSGDVATVTCRVQGHGPDVRRGPCVHVVHQSHPAPAGAQRFSEPCPRSAVRYVSAFFSCREYDTSTEMCQVLLASAAALTSAASSCLTLASADANMVMSRQRHGKPLQGPSCP